MRRIGDYDCLLFNDFMPTMNDMYNPQLPPIARR